MSETPLKGNPETDPHWAIAQELRTANMIAYEQLSMMTVMVQSYMHVNGGEFLGFEPELEAFDLDVQRRLGVADGTQA